jgi:hypothetical protein
MRKNTGKALGFETMRLEGSLFVADLLEKAALGNADRQEASDYRIPRGLRLLDEYGRSFQIALAVYTQFMASKDSKSLAFELLRDALGYADIVGVSPISISDKSYPISSHGDARCARRCGSSGDRTRRADASSSP